MRLIIKGREPKEWAEYRNTPGVDYQRIPALADALLEEQGQLCAYCMRRIPCHDKLANGELTAETDRIEHMKSRNNHDDLKLSYSNMVICCPGSINGESHCDRKKGENDINFDLTSITFIDTLSYQNDGTIGSSNLAYDSEINEILNLNNATLKSNRKAALDALKKKLGLKGKWKRADLNRLISRYDNKDAEKRYAEYSGMFVWYLKKKMILACQETH